MGHPFYQYISVNEVSVKVCKDCGEEKELTGFYKESKSRRHLGDGFRSRCKLCTNLQNRNTWDKYRERYNKKSLERAELTKESRKEYSKKHYRENKEKYILKDKKRKELLRLATPKGSNPHTTLLPFKKEVKRLNEISDIQYSIDHIVPLKGKNVSGLNVPWNIQIIPLEVNKRKSNKLTGDLYGGA